MLNINEIKSVSDINISNIKAPIIIHEGTTKLQEGYTLKISNITNIDIEQNDNMCNIKFRLNNDTSSVKFDNIKKMNIKYDNGDLIITNFEAISKEEYIDCNGLLLKRHS